MNETRFRGYSRLLGPEQLILGPDRVSSAEEYLAWQAHHVTLGHGNTWIPDEQTAPFTSPDWQIAAYVNHGAWKADCGVCGTAMFTRPDWRIACCAVCGARYGPGRVAFPVNAAGIEKVLCRRARRDQQNWDSRQRVEDLEAENLSEECVTP
jgi:hypothetical protein